MAFIEKKNTSMITWDEPKVVEADEYRGSEVRETVNGEARVHTVVVDGTPKTFYGTAMVDSRLGPEDVGKPVRIEFTGNLIATQGGRKVKEFRVFVDDGQ